MKSRRPLHGDTMQQDGARRPNRVLRRTAALVTALAMMFPVSGIAAATPMGQWLFDQAIGNSKAPQIHHGVVEPRESRIVRASPYTDGTPSARMAADGDAPVIDTEGYQQWGNTGQDQGIGWKIDADGTLLLKPWHGDTGTTGFVTMNDSQSPASMIPWYARRTEIKRISIPSGTIRFGYYSDLLFYGCSNLESVEGLAKVDLSEMMYGRSMFQDCTKLTSLRGLENWKFTTDYPVQLGSSSKVRPQGDGFDPGPKGVGMFRGCSGLTDISALKDWKFNQNSDLSGLFQDCSGLTNLHGLEDWDITKRPVGVYETTPNESNRDDYTVTYDSGLFSGCSSLEDLSAISKWNVLNSSLDRRSVLSGMFRDCTSLQDLSPLAAWFSGADEDTVDAIDMFRGCAGLTSLAPVREWKLTRARSLIGMFRDCTGIKTLEPLKDWDFASVMEMRHMFRGCTSLTDAAAMGQWNLQSASDAALALYDCPNLQRVGIPGAEKGGINLIAYIATFSEMYPGMDAKLGIAQVLPRVITESAELGPYTWMELYEAINHFMEGGDYGPYAEATIWVRYHPSWIINYKANGGVGSMPGAMVDLEASETLPASAFMRFGYEFIGWSTQPTDTINLYQPKDAYRPSDPQEGTRYTLYAQWRKLGSGETGPISGASGMLPGWVQESSEGTQGTIGPNAVVEAQFTNRYVPGSVAVSLKFTKLFDGNVPDRQFEFRLVDSAGKQVQQVSNSAASVSFSPLTFSQVGEYTYYVSETGSSETIDFDTHMVEAKITVANDPKTEGNLMATVQLTGETTFRNVSKPAELTLAKNVTGIEHSKAEFTFKVKLTHGSEPLDGIYSGVRFTDGVGTLRIKAGERVTLKGIPADTTYAIEETNLPAGYTLESINQASGSLAAADDATVTATNTYQAAPAEVTISAKKYVQYGTMDPIDRMPAEMFRFALCELPSADSGEAPAARMEDSCNGIGEAVNSDDGSVDFPMLTYTKPGRHVYRIREVNTHQEGIRYDTRTVTVTVTVRDDGSGALRAVAAYDGSASVEGEDSSARAVFVNQTRQMSVMPHTGDSSLFAVAVAALAALAVMLVSMRRRKPVGKHGA